MRTKTQTKIGKVVETSENRGAEKAGHSKGREDTKEAA